MIENKLELRTEIEGLGPKLIELNYGASYLLFSSIGEIQKTLFESVLLEDKIKISFINSPFKEAIKVPAYIKKHGYSQTKINKLMAELNIGEWDIGDSDEINDSIINDFLFVLLNEFVNNDVVIIETSGLSMFSIIKLAECSSVLTLKNPQKIILIVQNNVVGITYPAFQLEKIDHDKIISFENWYDSIGERTK